jgi:hypothetical protein
MNPRSNGCVHQRKVSFWDKIKVNPESLVAHFVVQRAVGPRTVNRALIHPNLGCGEGIKS